MLARVAVVLSLALGAMAAIQDCASKCTTVASLMPGCDASNMASCSVDDIKCSKNDLPGVKACYDCFVTESVLTQDVVDQFMQGLEGICTGSGSAAAPATGSGSSDADASAAPADASGTAAPAAGTAGTATGAGAGAAAAAPSTSPSAAAAQGVSGAGKAPIAAGAVVLAGAAMLL